MKENKLIYRCATITGCLLIVAALARAFSINNLVIAASTGDISKHYADSVLIDWSLSSMLQVLVAIWILTLAPSLKKLQRKAWIQAMLIGLCFVFFGGTSWYVYPTSLHLLFFLLLGLLLVVPLLILSRHFKKQKA